MHKFIASIVVLTLIAGCATGPRPMSRDRIERALAIAPGEAQPSKIVATEVRFARAAREDGQWTAFRAFADAGALLHGRNGPIPAQAWLASQQDPPKSVAWSPKAVWMSCDAKTAVSMGRFLDPDGLVGSFVTVWQRGEDGEYKWSYDVAAPDNPQPPKSERPVETVAGEIVVRGISSISGRVADCLKPGEALAVAPDLPEALSGNSGEHWSPDRTLRWRWEHLPNGVRRVVVQYFHEERWEIALDHSFPPSLPS